PGSSRTGCGKFDGDSMVTATPSSLSAPAVGEGVDVFLARTKEIQKVYTNVFAGWTVAQKNQIVAEAFFRSDSSDDLPERREGFDRMLGIVVVPWDSVIGENREQLVSVPFQTLLDLHRSLTLQVAFGEFPIESLHRREILLQKSAFQAVPIHSIDHGLGQDGKSHRQLFQFFVVRVLQDIVVQVPYQMDQACLLRTLD